MLLERQADISVVVAVYGVEPWIEESLRSLMEQTLGNDEMEVVMVDDCSPDRSMDVARRVMADYPGRRVKVITHMRNMGTGATRAEAVAACTGRYIIHFDPDDLLEPESLRTLLDTAQQTGADITLCDFAMTFLGGERHIVSQRPADTVGATLLRQITGLQGPSRHGSLCNKLIRAELYRRVKFPQGIDFCEDAITVCRMLSLPGVRTAYVPQPLYLYRMRQGSVVTKPDVAKDLRLYRTLWGWGDDCWRSLAVNMIYQRNYLPWEGSGREFAPLFGEFVSGAWLPRVMSGLERRMLRRAMEGRSMPPRIVRKAIYRISRILER